MKLHIVDASGQSSPFYFTFISVGTEGSHSVTGDLGVNAIAVVIMAATAAEIKAKSRHKMAWLCLTASTRADPALHGVRQSLGRLLCLSGSRTDKSSTISVTSTGLQGFAVPEKQHCLKKKKKDKKIKQTNKTEMPPPTKRKS